MVSGSVFGIVTASDWWAYGLVSSRLAWRADRARKRDWVKGKIWRAPPHVHLFTVTAILLLFPRCFCIYYIVSICAHLSVKWMGIPRAQQMTTPEGTFRFSATSLGCVWLFSRTIVLVIVSSCVSLVAPICIAETMRIRWSTDCIFKHLFDVATATNRKHAIDRA